MKNKNITNLEYISTKILLLNQLEKLIQWTQILLLTGEQLNHDYKKINKIKTYICNKYLFISKPIKTDIKKKKKKLLVKPFGNNIEIKIYQYI